MQNFKSLIKQFEISTELPLDFPSDCNTFALENNGNINRKGAKNENVRSHNNQKKDKNREDFRRLKVVCIDPDGARDHDDAISLEEVSSGYVLGVHIADVSHFVTTHSPLDKEAEKRGYTQYLPWGSVPMLPEILSADLCSLVEGEDRFSFSCIISLDKKCHIVKYRFAKGIIRVGSSITYKQAVELFDNKDMDICLLARVAENLKRRREENGLLEMDSSEYQCKFSKSGEPIRIVKRESDRSNSWIEECMLAANKCCALELQKRKLNGIYRTHEAPDPEDIAELMNAEPTLFFDSPVDANKLLKNYDGKNSQDKRIFNLYSHLVKKAKGNPVLTNKILRSMQKARYSSECEGHFALHWKDYAHFTSPIRRYADLWCHRELSSLVSGVGKIKRSQKNDYTKELCEHLNGAEIKNQKTERKALKLCASYLLQHQIGQTFNAEVQGIEEFGVFISISTDTVAAADGLVHMRDISGDYYVYNEQRGILVGKRTGKSFKRGDKVTVKLLKVNVAKGENDFEIIRGTIQNDKKNRNSARDYKTSNLRKADSGESGKTDGSVWNRKSALKKKEAYSEQPRRSPPSQDYPKQRKSDRKFRSQKHI